MAVASYVTMVVPDVALTPREHERLVELRGRPVTEAPVMRRQAHFRQTPTRRAIQDEGPE